MPGLLSAVVIAGLTDTVALWLRKGTWEFPSGAVLTAMIVSMVLRAQEPWYVVTITSVTAVLSKYLLRSRHANVFNPAALAIILALLRFSIPDKAGGKERRPLTEVPLWLRVRAAGSRHIHYRQSE